VPCCPISSFLCSTLWITLCLLVLFLLTIGFDSLSFELRLLITSLISVGHYIVCPLNYGFWLSLWYLLAIVLSVLWIKVSDYLFDICWPLYCLSFELRLLITSVISVGHCIVCPSNYGFWLPIWYLLAIVLSVLWIKASDYLFDICWPLYCLSFKLRLLITPLISVGHCIICPLNYGFWLPLWYLLAIVLSVLWITASDYPFDVCWPLYCLSFALRLLITPLISVGHCSVCPLNYSFWLPLSYLLAIVLSVLWITASDYPFHICWPLYCLSFELRLLITPFISDGHCIVCP
jgi:hypothetical protein